MATSNRSTNIRDECLNIKSFWLMAQARVVISDWKHDYYQVCPGSMCWWLPG